MVANWGGNTAPERKLRSALHHAGLRFFKDYRPLSDLRCTADLVFPKQRVCVFVDGCFWHGCRIHFKCPKMNSGWWREKIEGNRLRDRKQTRTLTVRHWKVIRIWEHTIQSDSLGRTVARVKKILERCKRKTD
jgi:DNA mismatch endonuclease (patch repair protein)